jgi:hypothetical protein
LNAHPIRSNVNIHQGIQQAEHLQQPYDHCDDHNSVQDLLHRGLHRDEAIHEPQKDTYHYEDDQNLK